MDRPVTLIVNPSAGGGRGQARLPAGRGRAAAPRRRLPHRAHDVARARPRAGARGRGRPARPSSTLGGDGLVGARRRRRCAASRRAARRAARRPRQRLRARARHPAATRPRRARCSSTARARALDLGEVDGEPFIGIASAAASTPTPTGSPTRRRLVRGNLVYAYGALRALAALEAGALRRSSSTASEHARSAAGASAPPTPRPTAAACTSRPTPSSTTACSTSCYQRADRQAARSSRSLPQGLQGHARRAARASTCCARARSRIAPTGRSPSTPTATRSASCR